jgi:serine/threonine protein kinase
MHSATPQPKRLGPYEITEALSVGRTWQIYRCFDPIAQRSLVLKAIAKSILESYGGAARAQTEARAATGLKHPGIVQTYGYGEDAGLAFVAIEYVEGWYLKERFRVPLPDAVNLIVQLLEALEYAHSQGVLHRAIKPSNLLLTSNGQLRITNFGVPRLGVDSSGYAAPEELKKGTVDRRSDVFSSGVVFYELLTGAAPFRKQSGALAEMKASAARLVSEVNPSIPKVFDSICARALSVMAEQRYPSARAFADGVRGALAESHVSPPGSALPRESVILFTSSSEKATRDSRRLPVEDSKPTVVLPRTSRSSPEARPAKPEPASTPAAAAVTPERKPVSGKDRKKAAADSPPGGLAPSVERLLAKQPPTLAGYLKDRSSKPDEVIDAFLASTKALMELYAAGNSKNEALLPENVCFDRLGKATIQVTSASAVHGTAILSNPRYAAPEMFSEKSAAPESNSTAADVYALGFMFYEILLGKTLFQNTFASQRSDLDWLRWHADLESPAPSVKSLLPDCSSALSDVIGAMLEKHVDKRITDLNEILSRLRRVQQQAKKTMVLGTTPQPAKTPPPAETPPPPEKSWGKLAFFAVIVMLLALAAFLLWQNPSLYQDVVSYLQHLLGRS